MQRTKLTLAATAAAVLGLASPAAADTKVSIETGNFGPGLNGIYLFVRDAPSFPFDSQMKVTIQDAGTKIRVTDAAGDVVAGNGCTAVNGAVECPDGLDGALIWGGNKSDTITNLTALASVWDGDSGNDGLFGGPGPDQMNGGPGLDTLKGFDGDDLFRFDSGADDLRGGAGIDTVSYTGSNELVKVTLDDAVFNDGPQSEPDRVLEMENLIGSPFTDFLKGNAEDNVISGRAGNDTIVGLGGDDTMNGNAGADNMLGGPGTDDTVTYADRTAPVNVRLDGFNNDGEAGELDFVDDEVENLKGGSGDDDLTGSIVANRFDGNGGDDELDGAGGSDSMDGDVGDDVITGDPGSDIYKGGPGTDTIDYSARTEDLDVTLESSIFLDDGGPSDGPVGIRDNVSAIENLIAGSGQDKLTGAPGPNVIKAGEGDDNVFVKDTFADTADCGPGNDGVEFDLGVDLTPNCEVILNNP